MNLKRSGHFEICSQVFFWGEGILFDILLLEMFLGNSCLPEVHFSLTGWRVHQKKVEMCTNNVSRNKLKKRNKKRSTSLKTQFSAYLSEFSSGVTPSDIWLWLHYSKGQLNWWISFQVICDIGIPNGINWILNSKLSQTPVCRSCKTPNVVNIFICAVIHARVNPRFKDI